MHALVTTIGTAGDVLPMIGLAGRLASRGHRVTVALNDRFRGDTAAAGVEFASLGTEAEWKAVYENPRWYDPRHGVGFFYEKALLDAVERLAAVAGAMPREGLVLVAAVQAFGAGVAHRHFGIPIAHVYLQPATLRWVLPEAALRATRADSELALTMRTGLRFLRDRLGDAYDPDARRAGELHLALFPSLFAVPDAAWPDTVRFSGFPLYDGAGPDALDDGARAFFDGDAPIVLANPGSNVHWTGAHCAAIVAACRHVGARLALLSRHATEVAGLDGMTARRFDHLPLGAALAHAAAMVHHAGISTVARCLAAGVPQLLAPLGYDHPFNARILEKLGVGIAVGRAETDVARLVDGLRRMLDDGVRTRAKEVAARLARDNDPDAACTAIESLA